MTWRPVGIPGGLRNPASTTPGEQLVVGFALDGSMCRPRKCGVGQGGSGVSTS